METIDDKPLGTGFLVARRLLLTNYHVVEFAPGKDLEEKVRNLQLRFRSVTAATGRESEGLRCFPDPIWPLLHSSPPGALDYVNIQLWWVCVSRHWLREGGNRRRPGLAGEGVAEDGQDVGAVLGGGGDVAADGVPVPGGFL